MRPDRRRCERGGRGWACDACVEVGPLGVGQRDDQHPAGPSASPHPRRRSRPARSARRRPRRPPPRAAARGRPRPHPRCHVPAGSGTGSGRGRSSSPVAVVADHGRSRGTGRTSRARRWSGPRPGRGRRPSRPWWRARCRGCGCTASARAGPSVTSTHTLGDDERHVGCLQRVRRRQVTTWVDRRASLPTTSTMPAPRPGKSAMVEPSTPSKPRKPACCEHGQQVLDSPSTLGGRARRAAAASCWSPSVRSEALFFVVDAERVLQRLHRRRRRREVHLSSSQSVPVAVASACWAAVTTAPRPGRRRRRAPRPPRRRRRASRPLTANGCEVADHALELVVASPASTVVLVLDALGARLHACRAGCRARRRRRGR